MSDLEAFIVTVCSLYVAGMTFFIYQKIWEIWAKVAK